MCQGQGAREHLFASQIFASHCVENTPNVLSPVAAAAACGPQQSGLVLRVSQDICDAMAHALSIPLQQRIAMGTRARNLFEADRRDFEQRILQVKVLVQKMIAAAAAPEVTTEPAA